MRYPVLAVLLAVFLAACSPGGGPSVHDQIRAAEEAGDIEALLDIIRTEAAKHAEDRYNSRSAGYYNKHALKRSTVDARAAESLRTLLHEREDARDMRKSVENALAADRDAASPEQAPVFKNALGLINGRHMGATKRRFFDAALTLIASDPEADNPGVASPSRQGLHSTAEGTPVDAILVISKSAKPRSSFPTSPASKNPRPDVKLFLPELIGLTTVEIDALAADISRIGVVYQYDTYHGTYSGDCEGTAYRVNSHLFVIDLEQAKILSGRSLRGAEPPFSAMTMSINGHTGPCNNWGVAARHSAYLHLSPPQ